MFGVAAGLARELTERRREVKPSLEVMVGCSAVGEPGCEGPPLGLKKEGVLEGRVEGACSDFGRTVEEDCCGDSD